MGLKSVQIRIVLWAGFCLLATAGVIIAYSSISLRDTAIDSSQKRTLMLAKGYARQIKAELETVFILARNLAEYMPGSLFTGAGTKTVISGPSLWQIMIPVIITGFPGKPEENVSSILIFIRSRIKKSLL
ncbi:hypothetical protein QUF80_03040 [Desulfococcaceae bacterium HSG8]|nr:hypothetical protein [Desulfococcaceae bacterium HSG8]